MPYYACPKCGSKDSYSGTEIVSEHKHKSGHMIAGPENHLGMTPVMRVGGSSRTEHKQLTVQKCRSCDTLLGDKDLHYTKDERLQMKLEEVRLEKVNSEKRQYLWKSLIKRVGILILGYIFSIVGVSIREISVVGPPIGVFLLIVGTLGSLYGFFGSFLSVCMLFRYYLFKKI